MDHAILFMQSKFIAIHQIRPDLHGIFSGLLSHGVTLGFQGLNNEGVSVGCQIPISLLMGGINQIVAEKVHNIVIDNLQQCIAAAMGKNSMKQQIIFHQ